MTINMNSSTLFVFSGVWSRLVVRRWTVGSFMSNHRVHRDYAFFDFSEFVVLFSATFNSNDSLLQVYTFMWISVDRYLAVRKPLRYETVQTRTREWNLKSPAAVFSLISIHQDANVGCVSRGSQLQCSAVPRCGRNRRQTLINMHTFAFPVGAIWQLIQSH
jgi:hypothetical protein